MPKISRGRLTALWVLLRTLEQLGGEAEEAELLKVAMRSGLRAGGLPMRDGLALARAGSFLEQSGVLICLTPRGIYALKLGEEDEPSSSAIRMFVAALLLGYPPAWVAWWQGSPQDLVVVMPEEERRVLKAAGLFPPPDSSDPAGWAWWEALSKVPFPEDASAARKQIGDAGEELSVHYERARLSAQGYPELADQVSWLARQSDAYGFDVLSHAGDDFDGLTAEQPIAIEVKSTSLPHASRFQLFLTVHEWKVANELGSRSVLHLWPGVRPGPPPSAAVAEPIVLAAAALAEHIPELPPCGGPCHWQSARLSLKIETSGAAGA
jgi:hypothetical protein